MPQVFSSLSLHTPVQCRNHVLPRLQLQQVPCTQPELVLPETNSHMLRLTTDLLSILMAIYYDPQDNHQNS